MRNERATSPRPPKHYKMAFEHYREPSPPRRQDTPEPTYNYRGSGVHSFPSGETEELIPPKHELHTPNELAPPPDAFGCRDCFYFSFLQLMIMLLSAAIAYSVYMLYKM